MDDTQDAGVDTTQVKVDAAVVERLKQSNPTAELLGLAGAGFTVVAKSPAKKEMDLFRDVMFNEKTRARGMERLVRACILHPPMEEVTRIFDTKPGLVERWADKLLEAGGSNEEVQVKKL